MAITWTDGLLAQVDNDHDHSVAVDGGGSRFGRNLAARAGWFSNTGPARFASAAWTVATYPVMSPPYVHLRPDLAGITVGPAEDDPGLIVITVSMPLRHRHLTAGRVLAAAGWWDWRTDAAHRGEPYPPLVEPDDERQALLAVAQMRRAIPAVNLPRHDGSPEVLLRDARDAVHFLTSLINTTFKPAVFELLGTVLP